MHVAIGPDGLDDIVPRCEPGDIHNFMGSIVLLFNTDAALLIHHPQQARFSCDPFHLKRTMSRIRIHRQFKYGCLYGKDNGVFQTSKLCLDKST